MTLVRVLNPNGIEWIPTTQPNSNAGGGTRNGWSITGADAFAGFSMEVPPLWVGRSITKCLFVMRTVASPGDIRGGLETVDDDFEPTGTLVEANASQTLNFTGTGDPTEFQIATPYTLNTAGERFAWVFRVPAGQTTNVTAAATRNYLASFGLNGGGGPTVCWSASSVREAYNVEPWLLALEFADGGHYFPMRTFVGGYSSGYDLVAGNEYGMRFQLPYRVRMQQVMAKQNRAFGGAQTAEVVLGTADYLPGDSLAGASVLAHMTQRISANESIAQTTRTPYLEYILEANTVYHLVWRHLTGGYIRFQECEAVNAAVRQSYWPNFQKVESIGAAWDVSDTVIIDNFAIGISHIDVNDGGGGAAVAEARQLWI